MLKFLFTRKQHCFLFLFFLTFNVKYYQGSDRLLFNGYLYKLCKFCNHLEEEEKAGCFAVIVLQMYCYYKCSVALTHGAVG